MFYSILVFSVVNLFLFSMRKSEFLSLSPKACLKMRSSRIRKYRVHSIPTENRLHYAPFSSGMDQEDMDVKNLRAGKAPQ